MKRTFTAALGAIALAACATPADAPPASLATAEDVPAASPSANYEATGWLDKTLPELSDALIRREITSVELTQAYLDRIAALDRAGPRLQSILAVNPDALAQAAASDARRADGRARSPIDGIPVLLKDNIESADPMPTTAGSLALKDNITGRDSPLVAGLRDHGAIILGKTNLSQWANFRSNFSLSGWSSVGGQVRNPHMLDRNPCGSSSGTGAAVAASLAAGGIGTETNGSIICPSSVNGLVGFKPTVGLIPQDGIVPISPSQDTAGPMERTVLGAALLLDAMAPGEAPFAGQLSIDALKGVRIGVLRTAQGSNPDITARFDAALEVMKGQGAELVEITEFDLSPEFWPASLLVLEYEFKASLNAYLAAAPPAVTTRTLAEVISFNNEHAHEELALFGQDLFEASEALGPLTDEAYVKALALIQSATRENGIDKLLADHTISVLVAPSGPVAPPRRSRQRRCLARMGRRRLGPGCGRLSKPHRPDGRRARCPGRHLLHGRQEHRRRHARLRLRLRTGKRDPPHPEIPSICRRPS